MATKFATWVVFSVLQCILYTSIQALNLTNTTPKHITVDVFCENNPGILCAMMYKYGSCCTSFRIGRFTIKLSDTGIGNTSSRFHHGGMVPATDKKIAASPLNYDQVSLQPTHPKTTTPRSNTTFVQCNASIGLYQASAAGNLRRVQLIVSKGLEDINCRGKYKWTPVMAAVRKGHEKVFEFLVSHGCDIYSVSSVNNTLMHVACKGGNTVIVKKRIENGYLDVGAGGFRGRTPLMFAAIYGDVKLLNILINNGSNVKTVDNDNDTILHLACVRGHVEKVKYILSLNIDGVGIDSKGSQGRTPVMEAALFKQSRIMKFLVSQGCNLSVLDDDRNTILHLACNGGNMDIVKYIISLGTGNEKRKNKYGLTPVQFAEASGHSSVAALIRERRDVKT